MKKYIFTLLFLGGILLTPLFAGAQSSGGFGGYDPNKPPAGYDPDCWATNFTASGGVDLRTGQTVDYHCRVMTDGTTVKFPNDYYAWTDQQWQMMFSDSKTNPLIKGTVTANQFSWAEQAYAQGGKSAAAALMTYNLTVTQAVSGNYPGGPNYKPTTTSGGSLVVDVKVNGQDSGVSVPVWTDIAVTWTSSGMTVCNISAPDASSQVPNNGSLTMTVPSRVNYTNNWPYTVYCLDASGQRYSDTVNVSGTGTSNTNHPAPIPFIVAMSSGSACGAVNLSWGSYDLNTTTGFKIYRDGAEVGQASGSVYNYQDTTAPQGKQSSYTVKAMGDNGYLSASSNVSYASPSASCGGGPLPNPTPTPTSPTNNTGGQLTNVGSAVVYVPLKSDTLNFNHTGKNPSWFNLNISVQDQYQVVNGTILIAPNQIFYLMGSLDNGSHMLPGDCYFMPGKWKVTDLSGGNSVDGQHLIGNPSSSGTTYSLDCNLYGGGTASASVKVKTDTSLPNYLNTINPGLNVPYVKISADKSSIDPGDSVKLTWTSTNAQMCSSSFTDGTGMIQSNMTSWFGNEGVSGTKTITNQQVSGRYWITCYDMSTVTPTPTPSPVTGCPTGAIYNVYTGQPCTGTGGGSTLPYTPGGVGILPVSAPTYAQPVSSSSTSIPAKPASGVTLVANPTSVSLGQGVTLAWNSASSVDSCTSVDFYVPRTNSTSGKVVVYPLKSTTYWITCYTVTGTVRGSVAIAVSGTSNNNPGYTPPPTTTPPTTTPPVTTPTTPASYCSNGALPTIPTPPGPIPTGWDAVYGLTIKLIESTKGNTTTNNVLGAQYNLISAMLVAQGGQNNYTPPASIAPFHTWVNQVYKAASAWVNARAVTGPGGQGIVQTSTTGPTIDQLLASYGVNWMPTCPGGTTNPPPITIPPLPKGNTLACPAPSSGIGLGTVEPAVMFIVPVGWTMNSNGTTDVPGVGNVPSFPNIPTQMGRYSGGTQSQPWPGIYLFSDYTYRTADGKTVLLDAKALGYPPLNIGQNKTSNDVMRQANGSPLVIDSAKVHSLAGIAPGVATAMNKAGYSEFSFENYCVGVNTSTTPPVSTKFKIGDNVKTTSSVNVRVSPDRGAISLGVQATDALGQVAGGPVNATGYDWWYIDYENNPDGWSVENYLVLTTSTPSLNKPSVNITASPALITPGNSVSLDWTSTNATSCTASGGWSGTKNTSGSQSVNPNADTTYTITCYGSGSSNASASILVKVSTSSSTVIDIKANGSDGPIILSPNQPVTLSWVILNSPTSFGSSCYLLDQYGGTFDMSSVYSKGSPVTLNAGDTFYPGWDPSVGGSGYLLQCVSNAGTVIASDVVKVQATLPPAKTPFVKLTGNPYNTNQAQLTWYSGEVTQCSAPWLTKPVSNITGVEYVPLTKATTFTINCTGNYGNASDTVTVTPYASVSIDTFTANPSTITGGGGSTTISWSSSNTTVCPAGFSTPSNTDWPTGSGLATKGTIKINNQTKTTDYTLYCGGPGGTVNKTLTVPVTP